jgi:hypothetical protein
MNAHIGANHVSGFSNSNTAQIEGAELIGDAVEDCAMTVSLNGQVHTVNQT